MRITSGGNVGINTTSPSQLLHVNGVARVNELIIGETANTYNGSIEVTYNDATNYGIYFADTNTGTHNAPVLAFNVGGSGVGSVVLSNSSTTYNTSSDRRLKENIAPTSRGLDALLKIESDDFDFINDPKKERVQGFIAQDLYKMIRRRSRGPLTTAD
jgi:endosialidase-like protein